MSHKNRENKPVEKKRSTNAWLIAGFVVLVVLLFVWLTIADLWGDTDVAADLIAPFTQF